MCWECSCSTLPRLEPRPDGQEQLVEPKRGLDKRGLSPNPCTSMDRLEISHGQTTGFDGTRPLRNCNPDGLRSGIQMAGFGGMWRDLEAFDGIQRVLAGFSGNRLLTECVLACKHSVQRRVSAWQATLAQIPSFPSSDSDSAPLVNPLLGFAETSEYK